MREMGTSIDKREFLKDLKRMKNHCINQSNYNPENDIAYLIAKYGIGRESVWNKIMELLSL